MLSKDFPVGPDAINATEQLHDILYDDELFDQLHDLADADADADARSIVIARMQEMSSFPDILAVLDQLQLDQPNDQTPAEPQPNELAQDVQGDEQLPQSVEESASCNMTAEGEYCPEHGLEECGIYEYTGNWTNFGLEENTAITRLKQLAHAK